MNKNHRITIESYGEIKISTTDTEYRRVILKDLRNRKTLEYYLYANERTLLWDAILNNKNIERPWAGEISTITVTEALLKYSGREKNHLKINVGDQVELVIWHDAGHLAEELNIMESFRSQCWKFKKRKLK